MNAPVKRYPSYKLSGVPWLGEVPDHWEVWRLKRGVANVIDQRSNHSPNEIYIALEHVESWTGRIRRVSERHADSQVKRFLKGDILFGKLRPYLAKVTRPDCYGVCVGEFLVFRPRSNDLDSVYLEPVLRSKPFVEAVNASTFGAKMPRAEWSFIGNMSLPIPPVREQITIVRYLNHMEQRIRHYISTKEKSIALLEEQKQAIIHEAVTGQIDVRTGKPYPAYKTSGVEWLGDVPEHWEVLPNRALFKESKEREHTEEPMLSVTIKDGVIHQWDLLAESSKKDTANQDKSAYKLVRPGDIAYNKMRAWQGAVGVSEYQGIVSPAYVVERPREGISARYLHYLLRTPAFATEAERWSYGITSDMWSLRPEHFKLIYGCVPSLSEQTAIVRFLDDATAILIRLLVHARRQIDLIQEYRTRLIADVVTGKVDVRGIVDELPDTDSIADPDVDGTFHEGPGIRDENRCHVRTQDQVKEAPT